MLHPLPTTYLAHTTCIDGLSKAAAQCTHGGLSLSLLDGKAVRMFQFIVSEHRTCVRMCMCVCMYAYLRVVRYIDTD